MSAISRESVVLTVINGFSSVDNNVFGDARVFWEGNHICHPPLPQILATPPSLVPLADYTCDDSGVHGCRGGGGGDFATSSSI